MKERTYLAIDLKSFYASVECVLRGLDPLDTNLVVADTTRTEKTICLAVSPSLKKYGISGRARLFEVVQAVKQINGERKSRCKKDIFEGKSHLASELDTNPNLELDYIAASPQMSLYMKFSTRIYEIYLKYISKEDIHVYSIDEVFIDATDYLNTYQMTGTELAAKMIRDVLNETGITATAGVGTNLYLAKIAMDIVAKHIPADEYGVRIAKLDERSYRELLWTHEPLTDFWRVGKGYARKLASVGLYNMGDIARCSIGKEDEFHNEDLLYKLFGINAELLIDHAWGYEPALIADIKAYRPENNSLSAGQVMSMPYPYDKGALIMREMAEGLSLDLVEKGLTADQVVITVSYDSENLTRPEIRNQYHGPVTKDYYGRLAPKHAHGTINLKGSTSSTREIVAAAMELYEQIVNPILTIRRFNIVVNHVVQESQTDAQEEDSYEQLDLFTDYEQLEQRKKEEEQERLREKQMQQAVITIKKRFGKNAIVKGTSLMDGATGMERNRQIGGHKA